MGVSPNKGDQFGNFDVHPTNIETKENEAARKRGHQRFPQAMHKPGGLLKEVANEEQFADAVKAGWYDDVRKVPQSKTAETPEKVSQMTVAQAAVAIEAADADALAAIEADEIAHGNRKSVMAMIEDAKDAVESAPAPAPKAAKPAKKTSAKKKAKK